MADVIKEYAFKISVEGNKAVIKEFKAIDSQVQKGTKTLDKQNKELNKTNSLLWTYAKRLISIYAIYKLFKGGLDLSVKFAEQGNQLRNLASSANVSARSLQKWSHLVKKYGGDERSVSATMGKLNLDLWMLKNRGVTAPFMEYMKNFKDFPKSDNAEDFLIELSKKIQGLSKIEQSAILNSLNLDPAMQELLKSGNLEGQLKNAKVIFTDEQIDKAVKVKGLLIDFNAELTKTMTLLGEKFLPALVKILTEVQKFLQDPKGYVVSSINEAGNHFLNNVKGYVKEATNAAVGTVGGRALTNFLVEGGSSQSVENKGKAFTALGFSGEALKRLEMMNYDISRFGDFRELALRREFERGVKNVEVYNDNAININGTKTPEQVAEAVAGNIIGISNHSLTLAGLGFVPKER
ncbi:MAG: hypothetical protein IKB70_00280 [Bacilli bacterium]|nr:hypothetical protein [Bacilli bacterium]